MATKNKQKDLDRMKKWRETPENRERRRVYSQMPKNRERKNALDKIWREKPKNKEKKRINSAEYYEKNREKILLRDQTPEGKERKRIISKKCKTKPGYNEKRRMKARLPGKRERKREYQLRTKYGLPFGWEKKQLELQDYSCAICGKHQSLEKNNFSVDHCHKTEKIRGLICNCCNLGLGKFKDDARIMMSAAKYLMEHR